MKLGNFSTGFQKKNSNIKLHPLEAKLFNADGRA
jgi:hypothetical protein